MFKRIMRRALATALACTLAAGMFTYRAASGYEVVLAADAADSGITEADLSDTLVRVLNAFDGCGLDFYNIDFTKQELNEDSLALVQTALLFMDYEVTDDYLMFVLDADELALFMAEAYGMELPYADVGYISYDAAMNAFLIPVSDPGMNGNIFKTSELIINGDGSVTAFTELYYVDPFSYSEETFEMCKQNPVEEWARDEFDRKIVYGKSASPIITFIPNADYKYFPFQLVRVETTIHKWQMKQGVYETEDGALTLSMRIDRRMSDRHIYLLATDNATGNEYELRGYASSNSASLTSERYYSLNSYLLLESSQLTLEFAEDAVIEYGVDLSGCYLKSSAKLTELPLELAFDEYNVTGLADTPDEPNYLGVYSMPRLNGLGDGDFISYINECMGEEIYSAQEAFVDVYNSLRAEIDKETDTKIVEVLKGILEGYSYNSTIGLLTTSRSYNAIVEFRAWNEGGAHGMEFVQVFNFDAKKEELLELGDVFKEQADDNDSDWKTWLEGILSEKAQTDEYIDLVYPNTTEIKLVNEKDFYLNEEGLVVFFQPYEIGPYSSQFILFTVTYEEIGDRIKDEYNGIRLHARSGLELLGYF